MKTTTKNIGNRETELELNVTYDIELANDICRKMNDGGYMKSAGMRVFNTEDNMIKFAEMFNRDGGLSKGRPATEKQISYMIAMHVSIPQNCTVAQASSLIDATKNGILGSVNGFFTDGSN
jgi:hypothetical protein